MKHLFFLIAALCWATTAIAQLSQEANTGQGDVIIQKDALLDTLVQLDIGQNKSKEGFDGYRIQLTAGSKREKVRKKKIAFQELNKFAGLEPYIVYSPPYFKLRVGDFRNRLIAYRYLQKIKALEDFDDSFIVQDRIAIDHED